MKRYDKVVGRKVEKRPGSSLSHHAHTAAEKNGEQSAAERYVDNSRGKYSCNIK